MQDQEVIEKKPEGTGKIVSAGKPTPFKVNIPIGEQMQQNNAAAPAGETAEQIAAKAKAAEDLKGGADTETPEQIAAKAKATGGLNGKITPAKTREELEAEAAATAPQKDLTDEEIKAEYEKRFPTAPTLTPEEIKKKEEAFEKRMLDFYVKQGGKIDEFALLKQVAGADLTELTEAELTKELKAIGITDPEEIKAVKKERYFQLEQAEIDEIEDPEQKALAQKKFDYGKSKLENKGKRQKEAATEFFNTLKEAVNLSDLDDANEKKFVSNVETYFQEAPRKMTLQLGKVDDTEIDPVEFEVSEDVITDAKDALKNIGSRKQLLFNNDGTLNHKSIAELVLKAKMFDSAAKTAYLTGGSREVEKFEKIFPKNPNGLGVGGSQQPNNGKPGKLVSAGKPERFRPAVNQ